MVISVCGLGRRSKVWNRGGRFAPMEDHALCLWDRLSFSSLPSPVIRRSPLWQCVDVGFDGAPKFVFTNFIPNDPLRGKCKRSWFTG